MFRFIARRLLSGAVLLLVISTVAYLLLYLGGGDIARRILGETASEDQVAERAASLGLDQPVLLQYTTWLGNAVRGDLGVSWFSGQPVTDAIVSRLAVTLSIVIGATVISAVVAVVLGVLAATRGGWIDRFVQFFSVLGGAIPGFLLALALVTVFAITLGWFKPTGFTSFASSPSGWLATATLPIVALSINGIVDVTQQIRGSVLDSLERDYVRTLRSRGLSSTRVIFKHVLRNAGGPALAILAVQFVGLLGGAVIIEQIFAIPGVGQISVSATSQGDIPLVMGLVLATAAMVVAVNLLIDLIQGWLNPKVRLS